MRKFYIISDSISLTFLKTLPLTANSKLARHALYLQQYQYEIFHTKGSENCLPDFISRVGLQRNAEDADGKQSDDDDDIDGHILSISVSAFQDADTDERRQHKRKWHALHIACNSASGHNKLEHACMPAQTVTADTTADALPQPQDLAKLIQV